MLILILIYSAALIIFGILAAKGNIAAKTVITVLLLIGIFAAGFYCFIFLAFSYSGAEFKVYTAALIIFGILLFMVFSGTVWGYIKKRRVYLTLIVVFCTTLALTGSFFAYRAHDKNIEKVDENMIWLEYLPYAENTKVAVLDEPPRLIISGDDLPILDGATALYPVYSAFARALYSKESLISNNGSPLLCSTTNGAYNKLINGEVDMVFAAGPSEEQKKAAMDNGLSLNLTPIGKEGFVFFVNSKNSLENITTDQIREIYSGSITDWKELGVKNLGSIRAFQREEGSGSQTALQNLMSGYNLTEPPTENVVNGMGGIISKTADYKNYKNAIGYSFRFYSTEMVKNDKIKLLSVNGVYPSKENIRNGTYPLASYFYAVTTQNSSPRCKEITDWILSEQGQKLIEKTGYTAAEITD